MKQCPKCGYVRLSKTEQRVRYFVKSFKGGEGVGISEVAKEMYYSKAAAGTILLNLLNLKQIRRVQHFQENKYRPIRWIYYVEEEKEKGT